MSENTKRILLMGNPNVGKSVIFSRLTGVHVAISNYPGTTVEFAKGYMLLDGEKTEVIDVPGTYSLSPSSKAEEVATKMVRDGDIIINVVDSTNLERNLYLTLSLIGLGHPMVVALNMWDETAHNGVSIDPNELSSCLGQPVIPTTAVTGEGIKELAVAISSAAAIKAVGDQTDEEKWSSIGEILSKCQTLTHHHHTFLQRLEDIAIKPVSGLLIALIILAAGFWITRFVGEGLINYALDPFFNSMLSPLLMKLSHILRPGSLVHEIVIGKLIGGTIDFKQSFGLLTTGIYIPFAAVLPYIISFYLVLGLLEDVGYLPRVAILLDNLMHRLGLHGYAIIPNLLGLGCNVPGLLATRVLESTRERFIASTLISIAVPCAALQAMIIGVLGERGMRYIAIVYGILFITWIAIGALMNRFVKGFSPTLFIEVPPLRWPSPHMFFKKFRMRISGFLKEAIPILLLGILIVTILYSFGIFNYLAGLAAPLVKGVWGLPPDAASAIIIGFLRKDVAIGMLTPLSLTTHQLVVACTVLAMFFPCIASFTVLLKELGTKLMLLSSGIMISVAVLVGWIVNLIMP